MAKQIVILRVDEDRAQGLIDALSTRDHIEIVTMDREGRKRFRDCPACKRKLAKEMIHPINEKMLNALLGVVKKMSVAPSVVLVNKENPLDSIPPVERDRTCEFDLKLLGWAETLGLLTPFTDGNRQTYFTQALGFLSNEVSHSPSYLVSIDGEVAETGGSAFFDEVKFKDNAVRDRLKRDFREAIKAIPKSTITFVEKGQMSLV